MTPSPPVVGLWPSPRRAVLVDVVLALGLFVVATNAFVIAGLLPQISASFAMSVPSVAMTITWYSLTVAVLAPALPFVLARVPRRALLAVAMIVVIAGTMVAALAPGFWVFLAGRMLSALGAAALVPAATAAAAALAPEHQRARALAITASGFTLAGAVGAPAGTALAAVFGWRGSMLGVAIIGSLVTGGFLLLARGIPREAPLSYARRLRALTNPRILAILLSTVGTVTAANAVYVYIGPIVAVSGEQLAIVLLVYGLAGLAGNALGGFLTDRFGTVAVVAILGGMQILAIATLSTRGSLVMFVVVFAVIGVAGGAQQPAVQHRMVTIDPALAATVLAWNSTALYAGLALAPLVGGLAIEWAGPVAVPLAAVAVLILALGVFLLAYVLPARPASTAGSESNPSPRSTTSMTAR